MTGSLAAEISHWQRVVSWGEALVMLGIAIEAVELAFAAFSGDNKKREHILVGFSIIVLIGGLEIERRATDTVDRLTAQQMAKQQLEISNNNLRASQAQKDAGIANKAAGEANERAANAGKQAAAAEARAGKANVRAATLERDAARLTKIAEDERLARLRIEVQLMPRRLSGHQREAIRAALLPFRGRGVHFVAVGSDPESSRYAQDFAEVFAHAGWNVGPIDALITSGFPPAGLTIQVGNLVDPAAVQLLKALQAQGIEAGAEVMTGEGAAVVLLVGVKP